MIKGVEVVKVIEEGQRRLLDHLDDLDTLDHLWLMPATAAHPASA